MEDLVESGVVEDGTNQGRYAVIDATLEIPGRALSVTQTPVYGRHDHLTSDEVIARIERLIETVVLALERGRMPILETLWIPLENGSGGEDAVLVAQQGDILRKTFHLHQCRSFTSILLVLDFCHSLLRARRTTTTREVYYYHVTHYRSQKECDSAIQDTAILLQVPRSSLGLKASPKGWFCGDVQLVSNGQVVLDGRHLQSIHGAPISGEWLAPTRDFTIHSCAATCILVIEKEGVYNRLVEDRFFDRFPCILVTGKGFPDLSTRALVHVLHHTLGLLPVRGLCDCNPYGVMVLHTYQHTARKGVDGGHRFGVPISWIGLRPSQVQQLQRQPNTKHGQSKLPDQVFQSLTALDKRRLEHHLLSEQHGWTTFGPDERRVEELEEMLKNGYKMELEALNWLGMDFITKWLGDIFHYQDRAGHGHEGNSCWMDII
jgi:meiotic recombination protein SPO11|uniref:DNA topoisomerase (ATP-hydrolyzing) n=1 Tax=Phaeodactylum tricornutum TaxID=2850 RepID=A0A8J9X0T0_PHATR